LAGNVRSLFSDLYPVSELQKASDNFPEVTEYELRRLFRSAEFSSLRFRIIKCDSYESSRTNSHYEFSYLPSLFFKRAFIRRGSPNSVFRRISIHKLMNCATHTVPTGAWRIRKSADSLTGLALNSEQVTACHLAKFGILRARLRWELFREDITLRKPWWRSPRMRYVQELQMSAAMAREPARSAPMCEDFARSFTDVIGSHLKCFSSK
jgi:hypothetical protein